MTKKVFITGEGKVPQMLCELLCLHMPDIEIYTADQDASYNDLCERVKPAEVVILLHEIDETIDAESSFRFTKSVIDALIATRNYVGVAYFAPKKSASADPEAYAVKMLREYYKSTGSEVIFYRLPRLFGPSCDNEVIDRIITDRKVADSGLSYELLHINDLAKELYRMINGVPAKTGFDQYAFPVGVFSITEETLLRKIQNFANLSPCEMPDFPSGFDRMLYDYYLGKTGTTEYVTIGNGDDEVKVLESKRFGAVSVKRLLPKEQFEIKKGMANGLRAHLLCGKIKTEDGTIYSAEKDILQINLYADTCVENIGSDMAVIQLWNYYC